MLATDVDRMGQGLGAQAPVEALPETWRRIVTMLDFVFQPIAHLRTGACHGFESVLTGVEAAGFADARAMFEAAHADGALAPLEAMLRAKTIARCQTSRGERRARLFLNVDLRGAEVLDLLAPGAPARTPPGLKLVLGVSERQGDRLGEGSSAFFQNWRDAGLSLLLEDFGIGRGGLKLLYEARPDYVKIARYFIEGIDRDMRKRAIVGYLVGYAHTLGVVTIAEGVANAKEYYTCRDLGCDLAQGPILAEPVSGDMPLPAVVKAAFQLNQDDRRQQSEALQRLYMVMEALPALRVDAPKTALLDYFSNRASAVVAPVIDDDGRPLGLIRERDLKRFVYTRFGGELLRNKAVGSDLSNMVVPCPACDINTPLDNVVEAFAEASGDGVIIVECGEYKGYLSSHAIVRLVHERNLALAADQNPLTRLPGNAAIVRRVNAILAQPLDIHVLVYFDFDNFKPFNDTYGFRQGDRAILMFAERLKAWAAAHSAFVGHIGGDDFFLAVSGQPLETVGPAMAEQIAGFCRDAESLYDAATREAGGFTARDRFGDARHFGLLAISAVAVALEGAREGLTLETLTRIIANEKEHAKAGPEKLRLVRP